MNKIISIKTLNIGLLFIFLLVNFYQPLIADDLCRGALATLYHHTIIQTINKRL